MNTAILSHAGAPPATPAPNEERRVLAATLVGTAIEWYDFFIYAQAAGLYLAAVFFSGLAQDNPGLALILSFATVGISFLFRPLGAIVCGWLGDRYGRKFVLVLTLLLMGASTTLIGLLPGYAAIGIWAPIALIALRIVQGFSAGGEWGGAALLAVEHAPAHRRSLFGSFPQIGVPLGLLLATGVTLLITLLIGKQAYAEWGWRIPFVLSFLLIVVGVLIRRGVEESPVFTELAQRRKEASAPLGELVRRHPRTVLQAALVFIANNAAGYLLIAFLISYGQRTLGFSGPETLLAGVVAAVAWVVFTLLGGHLGDRIGRVRTFQIGYVLLALWAIPMWFVFDTGSIGLFLLGLVVLALPLGLTYGPQAALYAEMFPASVRYSGVSVSYALGAILGGAFAPMIAQSIIAQTQTAWLIGLYIVILCAISLWAVSRVNERPGVDLHH